jgi:translation elongation factor EF-1alpha
MNAEVIIKNTAFSMRINKTLICFVKSGTLRKGMSFTYRKVKCIIESIKLNGQEVDKALEGDVVSVDINRQFDSAINSLINQTVVFVDESNSYDKLYVRQKPIHPKGLFESLIGIFKKD